MDQTVRVSYTPYPIKEADRFRLERLAKVSLPSKFRSEVTASDVDAIRAATKRSSLEGTRAKYATWVFGFLLGTGWILPGRLPRTDELFRTLLRRQMTPLRVTGFVGWNYATYRTGLSAKERYENMIFVNDIYRTGRHETIDRAYAMAIGSTMQEYFEHFGPLHGVEGATVRVQNQNDADLQKLPGASGATDNAESAVSPRLDDGEGGSRDSDSAPVLPPPEHLEKMQSLMAHWVMIVHPQTNLPAIIRNIDESHEDDSNERILKR